MSIGIVYLMNDVAANHLLSVDPVPITSGQNPPRLNKAYANDTLSQGHGILVDLSVLTHIPGNPNVSFIIPAGTFIVYKLGPSTKIAETAQPLQVTGPVITTFDVQ